MALVMIVTSFAAFVPSTLTPDGCRPMRQRPKLWDETATAAESAISARLALRYTPRPIQARPASFGSRDPIGILLDHLPATLIGHLPQVIELRLGMLIERRDP
jgi:hypothetical protein